MARSSAQAPSARCAGSPGASRRRRWIRRTSPGPRPSTRTTSSETTGHHGTWNPWSLLAAVSAGAWSGRVAGPWLAAALGAAEGCAAAASCRVQEGVAPARCSGGRLEAHPADAGEVHLRPGVPVVAGVEELAVRLGGAVEEPHHHARGDAQDPPHRRHGGGELLAVAHPVVGDEGRQQVHPRPAALLERVAEAAALAEPVLQRHRLGEVVLGPAGHLDRTRPDHAGRFLGTLVIGSSTSSGARTAECSIAGVMAGVNAVRL